MYESEVAEKVQDTFGEYREAQSYKEAILSTAATLEISKVQIAGLNGHLGHIKRTVRAILNGQIFSDIIDSSLI